jgi:hydrogenase nickel incorporation protein HypA/HybF
MHEISIIESILEVAEENAREVNSGSIKAIKLRLGQFTAIAQNALEFAFEVARQGTMAEHARLEIELVPMVLHCVVCDVENEPASGISFVCQRCGFPLKILSGKELQIEYIEIDECCPFSDAPPDIGYDSPSR